MVGKVREVGVVTEVKSINVDVVSQLDLQLEGERYVVSQLDLQLEGERYT